MCLHSSGYVWNGNFKCKITTSIPNFTEEHIMNLPSSFEHFQGTKTPLLIIRACAPILLFRSYTLIKILVCCRPILLIQPILLLKFQKFASLYHVYYYYYLYRYLAGESSNPLVYIMYMYYTYIVHCTEPCLHQMNYCLLACVTVFLEKKSTYR